MINILHLINILQITYPKHVHQEEKNLINQMDNEGSRLSNEDIELTFFNKTNRYILYECTLLDLGDMDSFQSINFKTITLDAMT